MDITISIVIIAVVVVVFLIWTQTRVEAFTCDYPSYCTTCPELNRKKCNNCINCGYCITPNGNGECVVGDEYGPLFREDCVAYEYNNPLFACDDPDYFFNYLYYYRPELFVHIPRIYDDYYGHHDYQKNHHNVETQTETNNSPPTPQTLPPPRFPKPPRIPRRSNSNSRRSNSNPSRPKRLP